MTFFVVCYVYIVICSGHYNKLLTYLLTYLLTPAVVCWLFLGFWFEHTQGYAPLII